MDITLTMRQQKRIEIIERVLRNEVDCAPLTGEKS
jgi:hypothetical protein